MTERYMPIGIQDFEYIRTRNFVYVDKTAYIHRLVTTGKPYFLGRPRHFGQSLLISALKYYFEGRRDLFDGSGGGEPLAIAALEKDWKTHPVFHIDLSNSGYRNMNDLETALDSILRLLEERWGHAETTNLAIRFSDLIRRAAEKTGEKVVILIDEYDRPLFQALDDDETQDTFRAVLKGFYGVLKAADPYTRFALLTGVTKFSKVSIFSDLNQLQDISMSKAYSAICGITESELSANLENEIRSMAEEQGQSYDEALAKLRALYDGYCFAPGAERVYNPFSVINCLNEKRLRYYWFKTGTPTFLVRQIKDMNINIPDLIDNIKVYEEDIDDYRAAGDNPIPLLYQTGYLTIKDYSPALDRYTLGFPNKEVEYAFFRELLYYYLPKAPDVLRIGILDFTEDLYACKIDDFLVRLKAFIAAIPYDIKAEESEHYFQTIVFMIFTLLGQFTQAEVHTHKGRSDIVVITQNAVYVFEFKIVSGAGAEAAGEGAREQIESKDYMGPYRASGKRRFKISAVYDTTKRALVNADAVEE